IPWSRSCRLPTARRRRSPTMPGPLPVRGPRRRPPNIEPRGQVLHTTNVAMQDLTPGKEGHVATETTAPAQAGHPTEEIVRDRLYIGGEWVEPAGSGTIDVIDSTTERVIGRIPEGAPDDVDRAVRAARAGFETWREVPVEQRVEACVAISAALAERGDEIAALIAAEVGMPLALARTIQAGLP